ncbi:hypothetical protein HPB51_016230 [Rhipicephalus microplus]|uniref:Uncharacterized protein n=1 Tax=Rhipicephalus microplus TaxID=6941 RepID=A0A9J6EHQ0_RHIMP|nr:hypothetical protein HPB51_016230 [Rhipicephalus microplus]
MDASQQLCQLADSQLTQQFFGSSAHAAHPCSFMLQLRRHRSPVLRRSRELNPRPAGQQPSTLATRPPRRGRYERAATAESAQNNCPIRREVASSEFDIGDFVLLELSARGALDPRYDVPFEITALDGGNRAKIQGIPHTPSKIDQKLVNVEQLCR